MITTFKKRNPRWRDIHVMADKDINERYVIKTTLPEASLLICLFHVLRSFRREISCDKMGITSGQRQLSLDLLQKLAYSSSNEDYETVYKELEKSAPKIVFKYFQENWHHIRNEWVLHSKDKCGSFLNSTNNRLESINAKLKQVINRHSSLEEFVSRFFVVLSALRCQCNHKAVVFFQKVKVVPFNSGSPESLYSELLTSYASAYVTKQLAILHKVKLVSIMSDACTVQTSEGIKTVTALHCDCTFRTSMMLPCRHIFTVRKTLNKPLFLPELCNVRWTSAYYYDSQKALFDIAPSSSTSLEVSQVKAAPSRAMSQHQKYRKATYLTSELASIVSESSGIHFDRKMKFLKELIDSWKCGQEVALTEVDEGSS